jgi:hypothetical protein
MGTAMIHLLMASLLGKRFKKALERAAIICVGIRND